jgi:hypothetical protein
MRDECYVFTMFSQTDLKVYYFNIDANTTGFVEYNTSCEIDDMV